MALCDNLTPSQSKLLQEIRASRFFSPAMVESLKEAFSRNGITPAVFLQDVQKLQNDRSNYIQQLSAARTSLDTLGVKSIPLKPGEAELGVLLPRQMFHNELEGFQEELKALSRILRTLYEVYNVTPEPIELKDISTSDPLIFLGVDLTVLTNIGHVIKWCIEVIKGTLEVRKIIVAAKEAGLSDTITEQMQKDIQQSIEKQVDTKVKELLSQFHGDTARKHELEKPLHAALEQVLERIQSGMTVEIRLLPPTAPSKEPTPEQSKKQEQFAELNAIAQTLDFPQLPGKPLTQLPRTSTDK